MMIPLVNALAPVAAEILIESFHAFLQYLDENNGSHVNFLEGVENIIRGVSKSHPDWSSELKRQTAFDAIKLRAQRMDVQIEDSAINLLIELIVNSIKREN